MGSPTDAIGNSAQRAPASFAAQVMGSPAKLQKALRLVISGSRSYTSAEGRRLPARHCTS